MRDHGWGVGGGVTLLSQRHLWLFHHSPLPSESCRHAQISAQILVCDVQQEVSIHLQLLRSSKKKNKKRQNAFYAINKS